MSQKVQALHIGAAYSCMEMTEVIYFHLMRKQGAQFQDTFVMSKGHGCLAQYMSLVEHGVLTQNDLDQYCKPGGRLGTHPDYGTPGIACSTGSLGHGFGMAVGMAYADKITKADRDVYVVMSDGEMQEGSVWEMILLAPALKVTRLTAFLDFNDFQSLGRTGETYPNFYPIVEKLRLFGWDSVEVDGHDSKAVYEAVRAKKGDKPLMIVGRTTKGKGVSYMENVPIWHYRSPTPDEYQQALKELEAAAK